MTRAEARTAVKAATDHDGASDTQVTDTQLNEWLDIEHKLFRRELSYAVPQLYNATGSPETVSAGTTSLTMPSDYEHLYRLEKQINADWFPVELGNEYDPHLGSLNFREEGGVLKLAPGVLAPGTYRLVYVQKPVTLTAESGAGGVLLVPDGCEDIITERVCARVRVRLDEDPTPHMQRAASVWEAQRRALRRRYGKHTQSAMAHVRRW